MPSLGDIARRQLTLWTDRIHALPVVVLSPHSRCNCRCVMCDIWKANRDRRELALEDLRPHLDSLRRLHTRWVVLTGGEPLMHSGLFALCELLAELDVRITLLSTGLLLARHAEEVAAACDEVLVSLDGSPPVHDRIRRVPEAFDRLARGVAALRSADPSLRIGARSVIQRQNFRDLDGIVEAAHALSLDRLSFLPADVSSQAFNRPSPWDRERTSEVALTVEEADELAAGIEVFVQRHAADIEHRWIAEDPPRLRAIARYYRALAGAGSLPPVRCNAPWVSTVVDADGTVRPCFFHPPLGRLDEASLEQILNSPRARSFRRQLDPRRDTVCRTCVCTLTLRPWADPS